MAALNPAILQQAIAKVIRNKAGKAKPEEYTSAEVAALSAWMALDLAHEGKPTRAEKRERNQRAWLAGDRSRWGGERRRRDARRGWRNFNK